MDERAKKSILAMCRGITFTEADGGMWKLEARKTVAAYLKEALADEIESGNVKVML